MRKILSRHPTPDTRHPTPDTRHPTPDTRHPIFFPCARSSETLRCFFLALESPDDPEARAEFASLAAAGRAPWDRWLADGCAPYIFDRLRAAGLEDSAPPSVRDGFRKALLEQTGRNMVMLRELDRVVAALNARGIEPALLKGAALLREIYAHPGHRRLGDLDLLVRRAAAAEAATALERLGYRRAGTRGHHVTFAAELEFPVPVELHVSLFNNDNPLQRYAFGIRTEELLERAVPLEWDGLRALTFPAGDQLLYLICHAFKERFGSLKHLADIYEILKRREVDWEEFFARAEKYKIDRQAQKLLFIFGYYTKDVNIVGASVDVGASVEHVPVRFGMRNVSAYALVPEGSLSAFGELLYYLRIIEGGGRKLAALALLPPYLIRNRFSGA